MLLFAFGAALGFVAGVVATVLYLVYIAKDVEEANTKFEASLYKGEKIK
jgi:hypothetical protein